MPTDRVTARDETFDILLNAADDLTALLPINVVYEQRWQGIETPKEAEDATKQMVGKFWTRAVMQVVDSRQSAHIMTDEPGASSASWTTVGQVIVQVFAPRNVTDAYSLGDLLAGAIADIYRNVETPSGVWYRNATAKEATAENAFWRWNVVTDFEFYERK